MWRPPETTGLAHAAARAGLPWAVRQARALGRRPGRALIVMYHRVAPAAHYLGLAISPAAFDAHVALLRRRTCVVAMAELIARLADTTPLADDLAAITFDDGYRDNLDFAAPILAKHGVPATVFVTTGFVDRTVTPLPEHVEHALAALWRASVSPQRWPGVGNEETDAAVRAALQRPGDVAALGGCALALAAASGTVRQATLTAFAALGGDRPPADLMLDWDAARQLAAAGVEIGSHTVSHPVLAQLDDTTAEQELQQSKARLEAQLDRAVTGLAFPYGGIGDYTERTVALARHSGYAYACTSVRGANRPGADSHRLRRLGVGRNAAVDLLDLKLALGGPDQGRA